MESKEDTELAAETAEVRDMLDSRYDDIVSGKVQLIDGEKAMAMLKKRTEEQRKRMTKP